MATRQIDSGTFVDIEENVVYPFFAVEMLFESSPLRLWTGIGDLIIDGVTWTGSGNLLSVSSVEETSEISVRGATLTLSGVPTEVISLALQEPYQGRVANLFFGTFSRGKLLKEDGDLILLQNGDSISLELQEVGFNQIFSGYMDTINIEESAESGVVELSIENKLIDLERSRVRRFTSGYQKSKYPGDKGLDFVENLQSKEIFWGRTVE